MSKNTDKDALGLALSDYWFNHKKDGQISITSDIIDDDDMPVAIFFRNFKEMPPLEQKALSLAKGNVLDIGAGAGCHLAYLKNKDINAIGLDISEGACKVMSDQGFNCLEGNLFELTPSQRFDTIYLLMNGIGICGTKNNLPKLLETLDKWLAPGGKVIFDSSDVRYLYEDEDGSLLVNLNQVYYGDFMFNMAYQTVKSNDFEWSYIDFNSVKDIAENSGWQIELIAEGEHYDYLAALSKHD